MQRLISASAGFVCAVTLLFGPSIASAAQASPQRRRPPSGSATAHWSARWSVTWWCRREGRVSSMARQSPAMSPWAPMPGHTLSRRRSTATIRATVAALRTFTTRRSAETTGSARRRKKTRSSAASSAEPSCSRPATRSFIDGNLVGKDLRFDGNTGDSSIVENTISGNLRCRDNVPPPASMGNTAKDFKGQCSTAGFGATASAEHDALGTTFDIATFLSEKLKELRKEVGGQLLDWASTELLNAIFRGGSIDELEEIKGSPDQYPADAAGNLAGPQGPASRGAIPEPRQRGTRVGRGDHEPLRPAGEPSQAH